MWNFREWILQGYKDAVGKMQDYQIILNATGYYEKGVLLEEDLAELQELINTKNTVEEVSESTETEETIEEVQVTENVETVENTVESEANNGIN